VDGFGGPVPPGEKVKQVVDDYRITLTNSDMLKTESRHADVVARFIDECQAICRGRPPRRTTARP
jgi:hypothetical protein